MRSKHRSSHERYSGVVMAELEDKLRKADAVRWRLAGGARRPRGLNHRRLVRTLLLGTVAVAASIYWLAKEYDVDMRELAGYLGASAAFVVLCATLAIAGTFVLRAVKRPPSKPKKPSP